MIEHNVEIKWMYVSMGTIFKVNSPYDLFG